MACLPDTGVIQGVVTDVGRIALAQSILGPLVRPPYNETFAKYFKIGEGGFVTGPGGSKSPRVPVGNETDVDSEADPSLYTFSKDFIAGDLTYELCDGVPYAVIRVFLDFGEANDDGFGDSPEFFEIGIFDEQDTLLAYTTFPGETKNGSKTLNHFVYINF